MKHARISADGRYLHVDTIDGEFSVVMYSAVNICSQCYKLRAVLCSDYSLGVFENIPPGHLLPANLLKKEIGMQQITLKIDGMMCGMADPR